jgi:hypothetical protein
MLTHYLRFEDFVCPTWLIPFIAELMFLEFVTFGTKVVGVPS